MTRLQIANSVSRAVVNTDGGVVESFQVDGKNVFYPRREIGGKMRGGCHVCAPYFGPGQADGQSQHGYGRDVEWQVVSQSADRVELSHAQHHGDYADLEMRLIYTLTGSELKAQLVAANHGQSSQRLTPGFHPYFISPSSHQVRVGDEIYDTREVAGTAFYRQTGSRVEAICDDIRLEFTSDQLRTLAIWTDRSDEYICIEPTLAGNSYSDHLEGGSKQYLLPGETRQYAFRVSAGFSS